MGHRHFVCSRWLIKMYAKLTWLTCTSAERRALSLEDAVAHQRQGQRTTFPTQPNRALSLNDMIAEVRDMSRGVTLLTNAMRYSFTSTHYFVSTFLS